MIVFQVKVCLQSLIPMVVNQVFNNSGHIVIGKSVWRTPSPWSPCEQRGIVGNTGIPSRHNTQVNGLYCLPDHLRLAITWEESDFVTTIIPI